MKKTLRLIALAVMLIMGSQAMAQKTLNSDGTMLLGASFPMGDFGKFESINDFALTTQNTNFAGAAIGFNAGIKWYFNVGVKGLGVMLSADGFYNGPNADAKAAYRNGERVPFTSNNAFEDLVNYLDLAEEDFSYKATPRYINVPLMLGLNYLYTVNDNFGIYVEAGAGCNFGFITPMETVDNWKVSILDKTGKVTTRQTYDMTFGFAYQAGLGFKVANKMVIGCSFYDLGNANVKGDQTIKTVEGDNKPESKTEYKELGTVRPMMILARIGFSF